MDPVQHPKKADEHTKTLNCSILLEEGKEFRKDDSQDIPDISNSLSSSSSSSMNNNLNSSEKTQSKLSKMIIKDLKKLPINDQNDIEMNSLSVITRREHDEKVQVQIPVNKIKSSRSLFVFLIILLVAFLNHALSRNTNSEQYPNEISSDLVSLGQSNKLCYSWEIFERSTFCPRDQDFCAKFNTNSLSVQEKLTLFIHEYHWHLNDNGIAVGIIGIDALDDCKKFLTLSSDGFRLWTWYSNKPILYGLKDVRIYSISHNMKFVAFLDSTGAINSLDITSKVNKRVTPLITEPPSGIMISDDDKYIIALYHKVNIIQIFNSVTLEKHQRFNGIEGAIKKVAVEGEKNDVIVLDSKCIKIYFLEANTPAILIGTLAELKKWKRNYFKLAEFEDALRNYPLKQN